MKLGPFSAGWRLLDPTDVKAMTLDPRRRWQAFCLGVSGPQHFYGLMFALRPVVYQLPA